MGGACISLADVITEVVARPDTQAAFIVADPDGGRSAIEILRSRLDDRARELFDLEFATLPECMVRTVGELAVRSSKENLRFTFRSALPDSVMEIARARRVSLNFDIEEQEIRVTMVHTMRHPTWLPAVDTERLAALAT